MTTRRSVGAAASRTLLQTSQVVKPDRMDGWAPSGFVCRVEEHQRAPDGGDFVGAHSAAAEDHSHRWEHDLQVVSDVAQQMQTSTKARHLLCASTLRTPPARKHTDSLGPNGPTRMTRDTQAALPWPTWLTMSPATSMGPPLRQWHGTGSGLPSALTWAMLSGASVVVKCGATVGCSCPGGASRPGEHLVCPGRGPRRGVGEPVGSP